MILPAVKYGLVLWGSCGNSDFFKSIARLHCRAARIIYNLPKDTVALACSIELCTTTRTFMCATSYTRNSAFFLKRRFFGPIILILSQ